MITEFENELIWEKQKSVDFDVYLFKATKSDMLRFLSHREWITSVERTMRRAQFPLWMTKGFHPKIKLDLNRALPTGMASEAEYFLVRFSRSETVVDTDNLAITFNSLSVPEISIKWCKKVFDTFSINKYARYWEFELRLPETAEIARIREVFSMYGDHDFSESMSAGEPGYLITYVCTEDGWVDYRAVFEEVYGSKYPDLNYAPCLKEVYWDYAAGLTLEGIFK